MVSGPERGEQHVDDLDVLLRHRLLRQPGGFEGLLPLGKGLHPHKPSLPVPRQPRRLREIERHVASPAPSMPRAQGQNPVVTQVPEILRSRLECLPIPLHVLDPLPHPLVAVVAPSLKDARDRNPLVLDGDLLTGPDPTACATATTLSRRRSARRTTSYPDERLLVLLVDQPYRLVAVVRPQEQRLEHHVRLIELASRRSPRSKPQPLPDLSTFSCDIAHAVSRGTGGRVALTVPGISTTAEWLRWERKPTPPRGDARED